MNDYCVYLYLLTPLHVGASSQIGNMVGIAREVHTEFPYIPASSIRGKVRSLLDSDTANLLFGQKLTNIEQPTEGHVWFSDASLLFFPVASYSHHFLWITCPLWLKRWQRWINHPDLTQLIMSCETELKKSDIKALTSVTAEQIFLRGAILSQPEVRSIDKDAPAWQLFNKLPNGHGVMELKQRLVILSDQDCLAFVDMGLQQQVRIAMEDDRKVAKEGAFRSEQAIPSETVMFFPWGYKKFVPSPDKTPEEIQDLAATFNEGLDVLQEKLSDKLQLGGSEGLKQGWIETQLIDLSEMDRGEGGN
ncbi:CRISPR type III-B/RAMP module RAMP protein Cmr4 [Xenococcus sp. PCC 7305]|uniref:type III-B CRISPR module RAMP protein Cmr4 n=1 Tax=Xenococcus sp. PCC 7305 TaxID=102125 RepID=UPI0002ACA66C|nr:type III-B CRISPR module RAMP protein Cmr4 [Xenococcus sp. PCC 7305]ELS04982.1 CRISPR type III-B/RAMP module RAMP protein Cmr4 [Xenococcus sp. PCC 7305]